MVCNMLKQVNMAEALDGAKLVGYNGDGKMCAWFGGYSFSVYDAADDWGEISHFTSGQLAGVSDYDATEAYEYAKQRMRSEGFTVIE